LPVIWYSVLSWEVFALAEAPMDFNGDKSYNYIFPSLFNRELVQFHFTYSDSAGIAYREPANDGTYKFLYGQHEIELFQQDIATAVDLLLDTQRWQDLGPN